jgi:hypothetical protein
MGTISAELKLVIAGNHDLTLDPTNRIENISDENYAIHHAEAMEIMTGAHAKAAGVTYLEGGLYRFKLRNGAEFTVYASPYTPGSGGWAFQYDRAEDRYNSVDSPGTNHQHPPYPIPAGVDIVMTHGPPQGILDVVDGQKMGCPHLFRAVGRTRPLMHCFGHIDEGHGAHIVDWKEDDTVKNPSAATTPLETEQMNEYPDTCEWDIGRGRQTLLVNAAIMRNTGRGMKPDYQPFVVALELPKARGGRTDECPTLHGRSAMTKKRSREETDDEPQAPQERGRMQKSRRTWI